MRSLLLVVVPLIIGCAGIHPGHAAPAGDARAAVDEFMRAVPKRDVQALAKIWGTSDALLHDRIPEAQFAQRAVALMCHLANDHYEILGTRPADDGVDVAMRFTSAGVARRGILHAVAATAGGWRVEAVDVDAGAESCTPGSGAGVAPGSRAGVAPRSRAAAQRPPRDLAMLPKIGSIATGSRSGR
jgi:hypothetical protein